MAPSSRTLALALLSLPGRMVQGDVNVYDQPMHDCGSSHAAGCTYVAQDAGAHEVCVTQLPQGFSSVTGQGSWSDSFTGEPWCICIWAYSNYILQHKDLSLQCESIPSNVLEEQYSLDKFKQCGLMSSTEGCGPEDIRRSIQSLCDQCDGQAAGDAAKKAALKTKCDAILASAPAASMPSLYSKGTSVAVANSGVSGLSFFVPGIFAVAVVGAAAGLVARSIPNRRRSSDRPEQEMSDMLTSGDESGLFARENVDSI